MKVLYSFFLLLLLSGQVLNGQKTGLLPVWNSDDINTFPQYYIRPDYTKDSSYIFLYRKDTETSALKKTGRFSTPGDLNAGNLENAVIVEKQLMLMYRYPGKKVYHSMYYKPANKGHFVFDTNIVVDVGKVYMESVYFCLDHGAIKEGISMLDSFNLAFNYTDTLSLCFRIFEKTYDKSVKLSRENKATEGFELMNRMWKYPPMASLLNIISIQEFEYAVARSSWPMTRLKYMDIMYYYGEALLYIGEDYESCSQVCKLLLKLDPTYMPGILLAGNLHAMTGFEAEKCKYYRMYISLATKGGVEVPEYMKACDPKQ